ncbi:LysR family transcriptional regulator [Ramlibacter sp.]|uniref:LysR family transcriptional regulator n=1 Tax=Ramlibacter sp. TaxID=1917967 RepID=UPI002FC93071
MDRLQAMEVFVRVVETGSFSKAAADLRTTQPTVTRQVAALEQRLEARLLNRNTRGVSATEAGRLYYEQCRAILRAADEADRGAGAGQGQAQGLLRIGSSVAFGRRVVVPLALGFMEQHPQLRVDLSFEDRYTDLVAQGIDVAIRLGRLADSSLGARFLGMNPWLLAASPRYLREHGAPQVPADLAGHAALVYSSVQGDDVWRLRSAAGAVTVGVRGPLRSNNLSAILAAARAHLGIAALPCYVAWESLRTGALVQVLPGHSLPEQEIHAVFPSPRLVPAKVESLVGYLQGRFGGAWWERPAGHSAPE